MAAQFTHDGHTLTVEREVIEYATALPQPDPRWSYTDQAGHRHSYEDGLLLTLARKFGEPYWDEDLGEEARASWLVCSRCGEKVTPGTYVDTSVQRMPGRTSYELDGVPINPQEAVAFLAESGRTAGHDFQPSPPLPGLFCDRCDVPLERWAGGACPGSPGIFPPGVYR